MHREGHLGVSLLVYAPIAYFLFTYKLTTVFGMGLVAMGFWSFAPDLDMELPIQHRGPTHSFVAAGLAGIITGIVAIYFAATGNYGSTRIVIGSSILSYVAAAGFGFGIGFLGVIGHLLGDVITPMGIKPWWPYSKRKHKLDLVLASNKQANQALSLAGGIALTAAIVITTL